MKKAKNVSVKKKTLKNSPKKRVPISRKNGVKKATASSKNSNVRNITKKRVVTSRKAVNTGKVKKINYFILFVLVSAIVGTVAIVLFIFPGTALQIGSVGNKAVLSATPSSSNTYTVNEDDLAMFAILSYESPMKLKEEPGMFFGKEKTFRTPDPEQLFTRCGRYDGVTSGQDDPRKVCMVADENHEDPTKHYMYQPDDIFGTDYEAKIMKDIKTYSLADKIGHISQWAMAAMVGKEIGEEFYFDKLASLDSSNAPGGNLNKWDVVDFFESSSLPTLKANKYGKVSAVTFKRGNDIVISYRGTDLTDILDWLAVDVSYAVVNDSQQDAQVKNYAKYIANIYNGDGQSKYNIYITGHSLGGYLAKIGASALLSLNNDNTVNNPYNLKRVVVFNAMGMFAFNRSQTAPSNNQIATRDKLKAFNTAADGSRDDKMLLIRTYGEPVSALGVHYEQIKTIRLSNDVLEKHNEKYKYGFGKTIRELKAALASIGLESHLDKYLASAYAKLTQSTDDSELISAINTRFKAIQPNFNTKQIGPSITEQRDMGHPFNGLLSYIMSEHEVDSLVYTNYYKKIYNAYSPSEQYGPNATTEQPPLESLADADPEYDGSPNVGNYANICTFKSNYAQSYQVDNITQPYSAIYLNNGKTISGKIICSSKTGFSDITISPSDFGVSTDRGLRLINIKLKNPIGIQARKNDDTLYYWDVEISPVKQLLSKKIRTGKVTRIYVKPGAVKSRVSKDYDASVDNETTVFPYVIETTNNTNSYPAYNPVVIPQSNGAITSALKCSITSPSDIKVRLLSRDYYYSTIRCTNNNQLNDKTISVSDIVSTPSRRFIIDSVSPISAVKAGSSFTYSWKVKFRGSYSNIGFGQIKLKSSSITDSLGQSNEEVGGSQIQVRR